MPHVEQRKLQSVSEVSVIPTPQYNVMTCAETVSSSWLRVANLSIPRTSMLQDQCKTHALMRASSCHAQAGPELAGPPEGDEHALTVARLRHERAAREALVRQLDGLRAQKVRRDIPSALIPHPYAAQKPYINP